MGAGPREAVTHQRDVRVHGGSLLALRTADIKLTDARLQHPLLDYLPNVLPAAFLARCDHK